MFTQKLMDNWNCIAETFWDNGKIKKEEILSENDLLKIRDFNTEGIL